MKGLIYRPSCVAIPIEVRDFKHLQELCGGYVERVILDASGKGRARRNIELWCNEDGIAQGLPPNVWAAGPLYTGAPIFGTAVILAGVPGVDGDDSAGLTDDEVETWMWLRRPATQTRGDASGGGEA